MENMFSINGKNNHIYVTNEYNNRKEYFSFKGLYIEIIGNNNLIEIEEPIWLRDCKIFIRSNNSKVTIKKSKPEKLIIFKMEIKHGDNQSVFIDEEFSSGGAFFQLLEENSSIRIGKDCMFSTDISLLSSDCHCIFEKDTNNLINQSKPINIGNHVWVGKLACFSKGSSIGNNSVVGMGSIVTKQFKEENIAIAGNPAKIIRENISWKRETISNFLKEGKYKNANK